MRYDIIDSKQRLGGSNSALTHFSYVFIFSIDTIYRFFRSANLLKLLIAAVFLICWQFGAPAQSEEDDSNLEQEIIVVGAKRIELENIKYF